MSNATGESLRCKECDQPLVRKGPGPAPSYCSGKCRAKAGNRRAKAEGRDKQWASNAQAKREAARKANAKPCPYCGDLMDHPRRVQCGKPECKKRFDVERNMARARKIKEETGQWPARAYTYECTCIQCGKTWSTGNAKAKYCSNACQAEHEHGAERIPAKNRGFYLKRQKLLKRLAKAAAGTRGDVPFVAGPCASCGTLITTRRSDIRWCSKKCKLRQKAARRRAAERAAFIEDVSPQKIFERDGWQCQLCRGKVEAEQVVPHPLAPTLDHIIPLARGGMHEEANVQCAHFKCNSAKRDRITEDASDLQKRSTP